MSQTRPTGPAQARTAVLVLNHDGREHLDDCLASLGASDVFVPGRPGQPVDPARRDEIWLVDNASTDGSVAHVRRRFPWVNVIEGEGNLGFPAAYNRAAAMSDAEYLVFLNNDVRVRPGWLTAMHEVRLQHQDSRAIAARIMSWDGSKIDFAGADTFFTGHAWQRDLGEPAGDRVFRETRLLFGCAGALLVHRETFIAIGGFDPDYFSFFEDVDLGWRAALLGYPTWFAPEAVVLHKHHGSWAQEPALRVLFLTERNALFNVFKNYHADRMGVLLLVSAALTFLRAWYAADALRVLGKPLVTSEAIAHLLALGDFLHLEGHMRVRRKRVQSDRRVSDEEVLPLFGTFGSPPTGLGDEYRAVMARLRDGAGIADDRVGGPWTPAVNGAAEEAALLLAGVCSFAAGARFRPREFFAAGWEPDWEHRVPAETAKALADVAAALARLADAGISEASLESLRRELNAVSPAPGKRTAGPSVRRLGHPEILEGVPEPTGVSVIVRTKDRLEFLRRALASVAAQGYPHLEVVVVNDGGQDPSPILAEFVTLPFVLVSFPESVGRSRAAQAGLEHATLEYVAFLDDDDELLPGHLASLVSAIGVTGAAAACCDVEWRREEPDGSGGFRVVDSTVFEGNFDPSRMLFEGTIPMMAVLVRRELALEAGGFDPGLEYFEDWDLWLRLSRRTRFVHAPGVTAVYHVCPVLQHGAGTSGNHRWPALARLFDKYRDTIRGTDWARFYRAHVEGTREKLKATEGAVASREQEVAELREAAARLDVIEHSLGWRTFRLVRRLLGRR